MNGATAQLHAEASRPVEALAIGDHADSILTENDVAPATAADLQTQTASAEAGRFAAAMRTPEVTVAPTWLHRCVAPCLTTKHF